MLAWLKQTAPGAVTTTRTGWRNYSVRWTHELMRHTGNLVPLRYAIALPPDAEKDRTKKWPTLIHLHGSGGVSDDPPHVTPSNDLIMVEPRLAPGQSRGWTTPLLDDMLDEIVAKYPVDVDRVYVTGESMGGYGTFTWVCEHPDRFAAAAPICGSGDLRDVARLKDVPIWIFHGLKDPSVPVQRSYEMVEALRKIGGRVRFTVYTNGQHPVWSQVYDRTPEFHAWLLQQVRGKPRQPTAAKTGTAPDDERLVDP